MSLRTKLHPLGGGSNEKIFIRPNLTSDGTLGGNSFAVSAQSVNRSYPAWQAVDNSTTTECRSATSGTFYYLFYNPKALKVTKLYINYASTLNTVQIAASNNTSSYTQITSTFNGSITYSSFCGNLCFIIPETITEAFTSSFSLR